MTCDNRRFVIAILACVFIPWLFTASPVAATEASCENPSSGHSVRNQRWECLFRLKKAPGAPNDVRYSDGYAKVQIKVTFTNPDWGIEESTFAFWDGDEPEELGGMTRFRVRYKFPMEGTWSWTANCEAVSVHFCGAGTTNPGLPAFGEVVVEPTQPGEANPLLKWGRLERMTYRWFDPINSSWKEWHSLAYGGDALASPPNLYWQGDAAWAAPMKATAADWNDYLDNRQSKGFNVVHLAFAPSWVGPTNENGRSAFPGTSWCDFLQPPPPGESLPSLWLCRMPDAIADNSNVTKSFWESFDDFVQAANDHGLYVFIAGVIEPIDRTDPLDNESRYLPTPVAVQFARWISARLAGNFVILSPGFDSLPRTDLMRAVGQEIKRITPRTLVTNHWSADTTTAQVEAWQAEPWLDFQMLQSGFRDAQIYEVLGRARDEAWKMSASSAICPYANTGGFSSVRKPVVNGEAIYEQGDFAGTSNPAIPTTDFNRYRARQAGYLSVLSGAFGYTFGVGGVWDWGLCAIPGNKACEFKICHDCNLEPYTTPAGWRSSQGGMRQTSSAQIQYLGDFMRNTMPGPGNALPGFAFIDASEQQRIIGQNPCPPPSENDPTIPKVDRTKTMMLARNQDFVVAYLPDQASVTINMAGLDNYGPEGSWLVPSTGSTEFFLPGGGGYSCAPPPSRLCTFFTQTRVGEDNLDRVLILPRHTQGPSRWSEAGNPPRLFAIPGSGAEGAPQVLAWVLNPDSRQEPEVFELSETPLCDRRILLPSHVSTTSNGAGRFLATWQADADCDHRWEVWGRLVDRYGRFLTSPLRLSPADGRSHSEPSPTMSKDGTATVAWLAKDGTESPGEIWSVHVAESEASSPTPLVTGRRRVTSQPMVEASPSGDITLAWVETDPSSLSSVVWKKRFSSSGETVDEASSITSTDHPLIWLTGLTHDAVGGLAIEWEGRDPEKSRGLYRRSYDEFGNPIGGETLVHAPLAQ